MEGALQYLIYAFIGIVVFALVTIFVVERKRRRTTLADDAGLMENLTALSGNLKAAPPISYNELLDGVVDQLSACPFPIDLYTTDAKRRAEMENKLIEILRTPTGERRSDSGPMGGPAPPVVEPNLGGSGRPVDPSVFFGPVAQAPVIFFPVYDPSTGKSRWCSYDFRSGFDFSKQPQKEEEKG